MQNKVYIDLRDLWLLKKFRYTLSGIKSHQYLARHKNRKIFKLHRDIIKAVKGEVVDHINGNTLDNRRSNLRITTTFGNNQNARKRSDGRSKWKGVYPLPNTTDKVWGAHIRANYKRTFLGCFTDPACAATAYNFAAAELHGEFAVYNTVPQPWLETCQ